MNDLKEISIKKSTCYYFDDMIRKEGFDFDNIFLDEKSCENILIYGILYKTLTNAKPLRIRFEKVVVCIRVYEGN